MLKKQPKLIRSIIIIGCIIVFAMILYQGYTSNKYMDEKYYIHYPDTDEYYSFNMTDEAKSDGILFKRWRCTIDYSGLYICKHCYIFGLQCKDFEFPMTKYDGTELEELHKRIEKTKSKNNWITFTCCALILLLIGYWVWLYYYNYDAWEQTPLAAVYLWFDKNLGKMEDENKKE